MSYQHHRPNPRAMRRACSALGAVAVVLAGCGNPVIPDPFIALPGKVIAPPDGGDGEKVREMVLASLADYGMGVQTRREADKVWFSYPIALVVSTVPESCGEV